MKICIPIKNNNGLKSEVFGHFGSAPYFFIFDSEGNENELIKNMNEHHSHGACHPMSQLADKNINIVICSGMGVRAVNKLNESGIKAYRAGAIGATVSEIIEDYNSGKLMEITAQSACHEHDCH